MNDPKQELIEKLKGANNILVTVSSNPSVDQLAACIGLTILLNKLKKHATAVFSGNVPSTIEFLKPDETLEKNTDSLRDFIIALDKSKADKLRYKVEENVVKIFITPYKTSITDEDLDFSQGDFNVDVVLTLGVREQQELDQAITAHGRILHDAVVMSVNLQPGGEVGTINWIDPAGSSLSELAVEIADSLGKDLMDAQIATALLTGIVAETDRFSNEKTSPNTMKLSAELMSAGANQQLVATELQAAPSVQVDARGDSGDSPSAAPDAPTKSKSDDGTLEITHNPSDESAEPSQGSNTSPEPDHDEPADARPKNIASDVKQSSFDEPSDDGGFTHNDTALRSSNTPSPHRIMEPPTMGGQLTANTEPEGLEGSIDPLGVPQNHDNTPLLQRDHPTETIEPLPALDLPTPVEPPANDQPANDAPQFNAPDPATAAGSYQPLNTGLPALDTEPGTVPEPASPANNQIHIDADGNLQMPATPAAVPEPPQDTPLPSLTPMPTPIQDDSDQTLSDLEQSVHSPHVDAPDVDAARDAVMSAISSVPATTDSLPPKQDLGASGYLNVQDLPDALSDTSVPTMQPPAGPGPQMPSTANMTNEPAPGISPADTPLTMPLPPTFSMPPANPTPPTSSSTNDPAAPPPVPPPMTDLPPFN